MWLLNTLRKLTRGPDVGQTFRDYIGCYLLVQELPGATPDYLALPTQLDELEAATRSHLQTLVQQAPQDEDRQLLQSTLAQLRTRLQQHLAGDKAQPFLTLSDRTVFVRTGVRERRKLNGKFVE